MTTIQYGIPVARIELLDELSVKAANTYSKLTLPETPLLLLEFHGSQAGVEEQATTFGSIAEDFGGSDFTATTSVEERNKLWKARHDMYFAQQLLRPGAQGLATDVCVPISRLAECVVAAQDKAAELGMLAPIVGHVGDGNFHATPLINIDDPKETEAAKEFISHLNDLAISMDGTCTGEHGIGQGKQPYLKRELGPAIRYMAAIKSVFDPDNIMNPGKILSDDV